MRLAIATEWIASRAGSEQVFEAMAQTFPAADLYALSRHPDVQLDVGGRPIHTTWLDRSDRLRSMRGATLPLMPLAWQAVSGQPYDIVITSSHAFARWFRPARRALHLSYVHAPARYLWTPELDARTRTPPWATNVLGAPLRRLDRRSVRWTDSLAANSNAIARRIERFYGRQARVIHPPVRVDRFTPLPDGRDKPGFALFVGRFVPYKRPDLAIDACARAGVPLTVAGSGPLEAALRAQADGTATTFAVQPSAAEIERLYREATVLVHPGEEDFGIVPVEAMAAGTPVLAYGEGGARDTVIDGTTGRLAGEQVVEAFAELLAGTDWSRFQGPVLHEHARRWRPQQFAQKLRDWLDDVVASA